MASHAPYPCVTNRIETYTLDGELVLLGRVIHAVAVRRSVFCRADIAERAIVAPLAARPCVYARTPTISPARPVNAPVAK